MRCCSAGRPGSGSASPSHPRAPASGRPPPPPSGIQGDGGSIGFADPDAHVGFGYVVNQMWVGMPPDPRALRLIEALYGSL
jgi:hypothetical protein